MSEQRGGLTRAVVIVGLILLVFLVVGLVFVGPGRDRDEPGGRDGGGEGGAEVALTLLHLNDIYELTPVSGGAEGGLARVATVRQEYLDRNPNTFTILAGDLLNPSALSTATVEGERLAGRQMVDVMNAAGLDYATFGNHEFDLAEEAFRKRLAESEFTWFSSNVSEPNGQPFPGVPRNVVFTVEGGGAEVTVGLFGLTVGSNPLPWVQYGDPLEAARQQVDELRGEVDILIAVTHLLVEDDVKLVQELPEIDLVLGGHEHENNSLERGADFTPILKADANARSMQVHELVYDTEDRELTHEAELRRITADDADDPEVAARVDRWVQSAFEGFRGQGFEPERVVTRTTEKLDGREATIRNQPTRLAGLVAEGMIRVQGGTAELAMFNAGSIRIDDEIPAGEVAEYDVIRTLPFGGTVLGVDMSGDLLRQVLDQGRANAGIGGYLQTANVEFTDQWLVNGAPIDPARSYRVAINDFLLSGREFKLDFLTRDRVANITEHGDIRQGFIAELEATYGAP